jgi:hypothetical protein
MENEKYRQKYLKYKLKYLNYKKTLEDTGLMRGGLIGRIPADKIDDEKPIFETPKAIQDIIAKLTIPGAKVIRAGSGALKAYSIFADIDNMMIIERPEPTSKAVRFFIDSLKVLVQNILANKNIHFSDFKAGGLHWRPEEVIAEFKDGVYLSDAVAQKGVVKMDIIVPLNNRWVEASAFYILKGMDGFINVDASYFSEFANSLLKDIQEFKDTKPFKAAKRSFSLARTQKNFSELEKLVNLVRSSLTQIGTVNADIETIELLVDHNDDFDIPYTINSVYNFKERLASLIDVALLDTEKSSLMIEAIISNLKGYDKSDESKNNLKSTLNQLHDYLLNILNKETKEYLTSINYTFPTFAEKIEHRECNTETLEHVANLAE